MAPLTKTCLSEKQVCCTIGNAEDKINLVMRELNQANSLVTFTLALPSYRGDLFLARCIEEEMMWTITEAYYLERLKLLIKANSHGAKFFVAGIGDATTNNLFRAIDIPVWNSAIKVVVDRKAEPALSKKIKRECQAIIALQKPVFALRKS